MNEDIFWSIIAESRSAAAATRGGGFDQQLTALSSLLARLPPADIEDFDRLFRKFVARAGTWDLWGVVYILGEGCSEDYFEYFRYWLVSMGREAYEMALAEPASVELLSKRSDVDDIFFETIGYVASDVYREASGKELPNIEAKHASEWAGKPWDSDDELRSRFPELFERYLDDA